MTSRLNPFIYFGNTARQAVEFYLDVFGGHLAISTFAEFGQAGSTVSEPINKRLVGGCHLTRPVVKTLTEAGFAIDEVDVFHEKGAPKPMGADSLGVTVSP
jgi:hypothetical protein